jgi:WD40 repeat protein
MYVTQWSLAFVLILCLFTRGHAQELYIRDVDTTNFPRLSAAVHLASYADRSALMLIEDGVVRPTITVQCPDSTQRPVSICIMVDTKNYIDVVKASTRHLAAFLTMPPSEIGITAMSGGIQIVSGLTTSKADVINAATRIPPAPGTDVHTMFYDTVAGGIPMMKAARNAERAVILVSDLHCPQLNVNEQQLAADCRAAGIKVFTVLLGTVDFTGMFRRLALATGGDVLENTTDSMALDRAVLDVVLRLTSAPCKIEWLSKASCRQTALLQMMLGHERAQHSFLRPERGVISMDVEPSTVRFAHGERTRSTMLHATHGAIALDSVKVTDPAFTVRPSALIVEDGSPVTLAVECTDTSDAYHVAECTVHTGDCTRTVTLVSGVLGKGEGSLRVVAPNGGEQLEAGTDTTLLWSGVEASSPVLVDVSRDGGVTWTELGRRVRGGSFVWAPVTGPASQHCLLRVQQFEAAFDTLRAPRMSSGVRNGISEVRIVGTSLIASEDWSTLLKIDAQSLRTIDTTTEARLVGTLPNLVRIADATADGDRVVSIHGDKSARIWDVATMRVRATLVGHTHTIRTAAFSPDGAHVLTAADESTVLIFDARTGDQRHALTYHTSNVAHAAWRNDSRCVAMCGADGALTVVDALSARLAWSVAMGDAATTCAWSSDGTCISVGTRSGASVWSLSQRAKLFDVAMSPEQVTKTCWNASGDRLLVATEQHVTLCNGRTGMRVGSPITLTSPFVGMSFTSDGSSYAVVTRTSVLLCDAASGRVMLTFDAPFAAGITSFAWSADARTLYTGGTDGRVHAWSIPQLHPLQEDISDAEWSILAPLATVRTHSIDCGTMRVGMQRDTNVRALLCNSGTSALHITKVDVEADVEGEFVVVRGGGHFAVLPNDCADVTIGFMPTRMGLRTATLHLHTSLGEDLVVHLSGIGEEGTLTASVHDVDFGVVSIGSSRDTLVHAMLVNNGSEPLFIDAPALGGSSPDRFSCSLPAFELAPGAVRDVAVRYTPTSTGKSTALLNFLVKGSDVVVSVRLIGAGRKREADLVVRPSGPRDTPDITSPGPTPLRARIVCSTAEAAPGDSVEVTVVASVANGEISALPKSARVTLRYNATMLVPIGGTPHGIIDGADRVLDLDVPLHGTRVVRLFFRAVLGNDSITPLALNLSPSVDNVNIELVNGWFATTTFCRSIGPRLFDPFRLPSALRIAPNPVQGASVIDLETGERDHPVQVTVLDAAGNEVMDLGMPRWQGGKAAWDLHAADLPSGVYHVVARTPNCCRSETMTVVR